MSVKVPAVRLGKSGLQISQIILGMMSYGTPGWQGWALGGDVAKEHIKAALELGINTFDTADVYSEGQSEVVLGEALRELKVPREDVVILTKVYFQVGGSNSPNRSGLSRKHIFASVKASLERLGTGFIDVLQCHRYDPNTPIEETMQALHDVVQSGMVRYIGMSSCYAYQFHAMQNVAIRKNLTPFISMQNFYNAIYREEEREMMPTLAMFGCGAIPWSPLARGHLTRPVEETSASTRAQSDKHFDSLKTTETDNAIKRAIETVAKARGGDVSMAMVATAWLLHQEGVSAPIIGTTKVANIIEAAKATQLKLTSEEIESISKPYEARPIAGHWSR